MRIIVTGGAGFIGSALVRKLGADASHHVTTIDKLTYAGNRESLAGVPANRHQFVQADIADDRAVADLLRDAKPDLIFHLAAESHVDRSIDGPRDFVHTNLVGTFTLLDQSLRYFKALNGESQARFRFVHVSTDEVFGSLGADGLFTDSTPYDPSSPYSATKAGSDHLARAWQRTYGLPTIVTNCSNNYGPYQFPEKLVPHMIVRALAGQSLPVYGRGENIRDWLFVDDHADALWEVAQRGIPGRTYLVSGMAERRNIDVVHALCDALDAVRPRADGNSYKEQIAFVTDRPGHDFRYAIDPSTLENELGWRASVSFEEGLRSTVEWYLSNESWWQRILSGEYRAERIGTGASA